MTLAKLMTVALVLLRTFSAQLAVFQSQRGIDLMSLTHMLTVLSCIKITLPEYVCLKGPGEDPNRPTGWLGGWEMGTLFS